MDGDKWVRNDGVTLGDMITLWKQLDHFHRPYRGHFTFFNRLQNIGYTREDMNNNTITVSGSEVYTIITADEYNNQTGLDGIANNTANGMIFAARTVG